MKKLFLQALADFSIKLLEMINSLERNPQTDQHFNIIYENACKLNFYALEIHNIELY
jgi:hypothetical protein